jgi:hypothetical protein
MSIVYYLLFLRHLVVLVLVVLVVLLIFRITRPFGLLLSDFPITSGIFAR